jgi:hypothetical protein
VYDFFQLFDYADASVPNGNRSASTVATQSLFMMNGPLVIEAAESLATRLMQVGTHDQRITRLYWDVLGREPSRDEIHRANQLIRDLEGLLTEEAGAESPQEHLVWTALCQAVLATSEFVFIP